MHKEAEQLQDKPIVFYDGTCGFCQGAVQFVLRHNKKQNLYFAPLQSDLFKTFLPDVALPDPMPDAVFFYEQGRLFSESDAGLRIARHLDTPFSWLYYFRILPQAVRNALYRFIAKHRYKIAGRTASCVLPDSAQRQRFLGDYS